MVRYVSAGYFTIDKNEAEFVIKPFAIWRKAWPLSNTLKGKING